VRLKSIRAIPFHQSRDASVSIGTAGSPAKLESSPNIYRWAENYPVVDSTRFETAIVRIELDSGETGWGESQAPVAPEVACAVVNHVLSPILQDLAFDGTFEEIQSSWWKMYSAMRVRGHFGGCMLDGIAGVDLALWDLAGKIADLSVSALIGQARKTVPAYLSGLPGNDAQRALDSGFTHIKVFHDATLERLLSNLDVLSSKQVAVDAPWRLTLDSARQLAPELQSRGIIWLEAPLAPESAQAHGELASSIETPSRSAKAIERCSSWIPFSPRARPLRVWMQTCARRTPCHKVR
jgi:galactonate dehydratase